MERIVCDLASNLGHSQENFVDSFLYPEVFSLKMYRLAFTFYGKEQMIYFFSA